jgi:hypothetical protein
LTLLLTQSMRKKDFSIFSSLHHFLSTMVYSFPCKGPSHPFLCLLLDILLLRILNGIIFLHSFSICSSFVYRKASDFCELILYPTTLLNLFMMFRKFLWVFSVWDHVLQVVIVWLLPVYFIFHLFLLPVLLLWLRIPRLWWRVERMDTLVYFLTLEEIVSVFPI